MTDIDTETDFFTDSSAAALASALHARCFDDPWNEDAFVSALNIPGTILQVMCVAKEPAAFALYRQVLDESEILSLGTLPELRGKGLATRLLDNGIKFLRERKTQILLLEVGVQNIAAQQLYRAKGFREIGRRPNYYNHGAGGEDAIMMKLQL